MLLHYTVYSPTQNITALVETPVPRQRQAAAADCLMARLPQVEQVGFLENAATPARLRLQMMGGEFCGNAAMSAACHVAERDGLAVGGVCDIPLEVSGVEGGLLCRIERRSDFFLGTVAMPLPTSLGMERLCLPGGPVMAPTVRFPGIVHCILPAPLLTDRQAEAAIRSLCAALKADACGLLLLEEETCFFRPLVYVAATDTAVWESGCGSGSAAIGCHLAALGNPAPFSLRQPGGSIQVRAVWDGSAVTTLTITGRVYNIHRDSMEISMDMG